MLLIYLTNLIKYPTVPRFRKVNLTHPPTHPPTHIPTHPPNHPPMESGSSFKPPRSPLPSQPTHPPTHPPTQVALINNGYKERVSKIKGHEAFFRSLGYVEATTCFEWEGHLADGQEVGPLPTHPPTHPPTRLCPSAYYINPPTHPPTHPPQAKENTTILQTAVTVLTALKNGGDPSSLPYPTLPPLPEGEEEEEEEEEGSKKKEEEDQEKEQVRFNPPSHTPSHPPTHPPHRRSSPLSVLVKAKRRRWVGRRRERKGVGCRATPSHSRRSWK